ncbi:hypothetical protein N7G274_007403 [Stereocaulon virgatum]|uniref:Uncharacterized protein n=1 Tax=Stereocaulon virgatum TaxID=373712 RepID=A0ABR4A3I4_9LECA
MAYYPGPSLLGLLVVSATASLYERVDKSRALLSTQKITLNPTNAYPNNSAFIKPTIAAENKSCSGPKNKIGVLRRQIAAAQAIDGVNGVESRLFCSIEDDPTESQISPAMTLDSSMTTAALETYMAEITAQAAQTSAIWDPPSLSPVQMSQLYQALQLPPSNSSVINVQKTLSTDVVKNHPPTVGVPMVSQAAAASTGLVIPPPVVSLPTTSSLTPPATSTTYLASKILITGVPMGSGGLPSPSDEALGVSVTLGLTGATATDSGASGMMPSVSSPGPVSPPFPMGNNTVVATHGGPSLTAGMHPVNSTGLVPFQGKGSSRRALAPKWRWAIIACAVIVFRPRH